MRNLKREAWLDKMDNYSIIVQGGRWYEYIGGLNTFQLNDLYNDLLEVETFDSSILATRFKIEWDLNDRDNLLHALKCVDIELSVREGFIYKLSKSAKPWQLRLTALIILIGTGIGLYCAITGKF